MAKRNKRNPQLAKLPTSRFCVAKKFFRSDLGSAGKVRRSKSIAHSHDLPIPKSHRQGLSLGVAEAAHIRQTGPAHVLVSKAFWVAQRFKRCVDSNSRIENAKDTVP
jgi:hypothetical protein